MRHAPTLCVVVHDVAPPTRAACERLMQAVACVAGPLPMTLLAVPCYHGVPRSAEFECWLRERWAHGDEVALHGYTHVDDGRPRGWVDHLRRQVYTRGEGEFWALNEREALRRLANGGRWFRDMGLPLHGFVAPAWLMGPGAWAALRHVPLAYTCTLGSLYSLRDGTRQRMFSQGLVYSTSSAWRHACSIAWNNSIAFMQQRRPLLRFELHPHDADHPAVRRSWQRLLEAALMWRTPVTLAQAAGMLAFTTPQASTTTAR
jgi:predicted deacetylase